MPPPVSAGIALWRRAPDLQLLLVHFGGPYWARKDAGAWGIPKGLVEPGETPETAARREFQEELGHPPPAQLERLVRFRQNGGKWVEAFGGEGDLDPNAIASATFTLEWPRGSGRIEHFPEVDRAAWVGITQARAKILPSQLPVLEALERLATR